jgi:hypothetical protein
MMECAVYNYFASSYVKLKSSVPLMRWHSQGVRAFSGDSRLFSGEAEQEFRINFREARTKHYYYQLLVLLNSGSKRRPNRIEGGEAL